MSQAVVNPEIVRTLLLVAGACLSISFALLLGCFLEARTERVGFVLSLISSFLYAGIAAVHEVHWVGLAGSLIVMIGHIAWIGTRPGKRVMLKRERLAMEGYKQLMKEEGERTG